DHHFITLRHARLAELSGRDTGHAQAAQVDRTTVRDFVESPEPRRCRTLPVRKVLDADVEDGNAIRSRGFDHPSTTLHDARHHRHVVAGFTDSTLGCYRTLLHIDND